MLIGKKINVWKVNSLCSQLFADTTKYFHFLSAIFQQLLRWHKSVMLFHLQDDLPFALYIPVLLSLYVGLTNHFLRFAVFSFIEINEMSLNI